MGISLIAAVAKNRVIGKDNKMPWHIPSELKRFKATTLGGTLIMGRRTFESIGQPLPGRDMIVISRNPGYQLGNCGYKLESCLLAQSLKEALGKADPEKEIFIAGGSQIYELAWPHVDTFYLTQIELDVDGDAYLPDFDLSKFQEVATDRIEGDPTYTCYTYKKS